MAKKKLAVVGYVVRNGTKVKRKELAQEEQRHLAVSLTNAAMKAAGYVPVRKSKEDERG